MKNMKKWLLYNEDYSGAAGFTGKSFDTLQEALEYYEE